jgi:hypothetical protein
MKRTKLMNDKELAEARERVAALETRQALQGFNPMEEASLAARRQPGTGGQTPTNSNVIETAERSAKEGERSSQVAQARFEESRAEAIRQLQAGQSPDNQMMIRASVTFR